MIRIFIVDDHPHTCDGLAEWLPMNNEDIEVVGTSYSGWEALEKIEALQNEALQPDVILLDCKLPDLDGSAIAREISLQGWPVEVLAFSGHDDWETVRLMIKAGAKGYLLKMEKRETILEAIRTVARGENWYSQPITELLVQKSSQVDEIEEENLTPREINVLHWVAQGLTSKQIALELKIGPRTVETHIAKIYKKLGAQNKGDAVRIAGQRGLLK